MNVVRVLPLAIALLLGATATSRPAIADTCAKEVDTTTITLKKDQSTADAEKLGQFNCWMPKPPASNKHLCRHDSATAHTFSITLANECDVSVRLMLNLRGGGSLNFQEPECGSSAVLLNDFLAGGHSKTFRCTTPVYSTLHAKRATDFELKASHVDDGTGPPEPVNVNYDPEIAVKDPSGFSPLVLWAVVIIGGGLAVWFLVRWFRRQSVR